MRLGRAIRPSGPGGGVRANPEPSMSRKASK
jgi:hypothetical protein